MMLNIKYQKGFTLIELLVVISIIGLLSSVVLSSVNASRIKGKIATIKTNLENMIPQAELLYDGGYSAVCSNSEIMKMMTAITNTGATVSCYSYDNNRWGVSVRLNSDSTKNFSVDGNGVVIWDTVDKPISDINTAIANCAATGGRLPSVEEIVSLFLAYNSTLPPGFVGDPYWSNTPHSSYSDVGYIVTMFDGTVDWDTNNSGYQVRCVN